MILHKEFYFIRHGQTDHNVLSEADNGNHSDDISLNETGRNQAKAVEPLIQTLPIKTICSSPLKRAQETKDILTAKLPIKKFELLNLTECSLAIWLEMTSFGKNASNPYNEPVLKFIHRVKDGVNEALLNPGPGLIIAHGGIHWALCYLMQIQEHEWLIENCVPVHFFPSEDGKWSAKILKQCLDVF